MAGPLELTVGFLNKDCLNSVKENVELALLQLSNPMDLLQVTTSEALTGNLLTDLLESPLGQLGQDLLIRKVEEKSKEAVDNLLGSSDLLDKLEDAQQTVFNTIISAMTVNTDVALFLLQRLAQQAVSAIQDKRNTLNSLEERLRHLYNALVILAAGNPQFNAYLVKLRRALILVNQAKADIQIVRSTYVARELFLSRNFSNAEKNIAQAIDILAPKKNNVNETKFNLSTILEAVGAPSSEQELTVMLSIPVLAKDVLLAADSYFIKTATVNALLAAFVAGYGQLQKATAGKIKDYNVKLFTTVEKELDRVSKNMAANINGDPLRIESAKPGYKPRPSVISGLALDWSIDLKIIQNLLRAVPTKGLTQLDATNAALAAYNMAVKTIRSKGDRRSALAFLKASEGQEEVFQLEQQLFTFLASSQRALTSLGVVNRALLSQGRGMLDRFTLTRAQDQEIEEALQRFIDTPIPDSVKQIGEGIFKLLAAMGMDRAADLLSSGQYANFFSMKSKESTYVGAALVGLSGLRDCLGSLSVPDFGFPLGDLELRLRGLFFAFGLRLRRRASNNYRLQIKFNLKKLEGCTGLQAKVRGLGSLCGLKDSLAPSKLFNSLSGALGANLNDRIGV